MTEIFDFLKDHWIVTSLIGFGAFLVATLTVIGGIGGGINSLIDVKNLLFPNKEEKSPDPTFGLKLVNIDATMGIEEGTHQTRGINLIGFSAILRNDDSKPVWVTVDDVQSNLEDSKPLPETVAWPILDMNQGIMVSLDAGSIRRQIMPGQSAAGRINWIIKYGHRRDDLNQTMRIKGSIRVTPRGDQNLFTWEPDANSVRPSGMKAFAVRQTSMDGR